MKDSLIHFMHFNFSLLSFGLLIAVCHNLCKRRNNNSVFYKWTMRAFILLLVYMALHIINLAGGPILKIPIWVDPFFVLFMVLIPIFPFLRIFLPQTSDGKRRRRLRWLRICISLIFAGLSIWAAFSEQSFRWAVLFSGIILCLDSVGVFINKKHEKMIRDERCLLYLQWSQTIMFPVIVIVSLWNQPEAACVCAMAVMVVHYSVNLTCLKRTVFTDEEIKEIEKTEIQSSSKEKTQGLMTPQKYETIYQKLVLYMEQESPYLDPEFSLQRMADDLCTNKTYISLVLNNNYEKGFHAFINKYRIREAKRLAKRNPAVKMTSLCRSCGFKSMSAFTEAFKNVLGTTPGEWCRTQKFENNEKAAFIYK